MVWFKKIANHKRLQQFVAGNVHGRKNDDEKKKKRETAKAALKR